MPLVLLLLGSFVIHDIIHRCENPEIWFVFVDKLKKSKCFNVICHLHLHFRGHPGGGHGRRCDNEQPMADPYTTQVLFCVRPFVRGEAGLDWAHRRLPDKPAGRREHPTWLPLCYFLDPRPGRLQMHALLQQVHWNQTATPLQKLRLSGLQFVLQTASSDRPHSPQEEVESLPYLPHKE